MRTNSLDWISLLLAIVGALNWGLIGLVEYNFVRQLMVAVFTPDVATTVERLIYTLVGLAGLYLLYTAYKMSQDRRHNRETRTANP